MKKTVSFLLALLLSFSCLLVGCGPQEEHFTYGDEYESSEKQDVQDAQYEPIDLGNGLTVPAYSGSPYVSIGDGTPTFSAQQLVTKSYEKYSSLDFLGRCGVVEACIGVDLMPTEDRESISHVKPSGWVNKEYDKDLVDGRYIYNRSHLIGFQLTGENANERNLITGTRYFNVEGMLPFENMVADFLKEEPSCHVMYRVTPVYVGNDLVARGVLMEAYSVEDRGESVCFYVFVYNVQPGIVIDYATGDNWLSGEAPTLEPEEPSEEYTDSDGKTITYVVNTYRNTFHNPSCSSVTQMNEENRTNYTGTREALVAEGYKPCGNCKP